MASWPIERVTGPAQVDDVLAIGRLSFTKPWTREMFLAELENPAVSFCYLARRADGEAVGFSAVWLIVDELHINNLAVAPGHRRCGVETALLNHLLAEGMTHHAVRATLEVRRSNEAARELYRRAGFVEGGVRHAYYTDPVEDAVILWREGLSAAGS